MSRDFNLRINLSSEDIWDRMPNEYLIEGAKYALALMVQHGEVQGVTARDCCEHLDEVLYEFRQTQANRYGYEYAGVEPEEGWE